MFLKARVRPHNIDVFKNKLLSLGINPEEDNGVLYIDQQVSAFNLVEIKELLDSELDSEYEFFTKRVFFKKKKE